jgi:heme exporter protein A
MWPGGVLLEARAINAWRGDSRLLSNVSFTVNPGQFLQITGPNGVGKTTLLRILCGLLPAESGEVWWRGAAVWGPASVLSAELSYLGHQNAVKADLTVNENLRYLCGLRSAVDDGACAVALERVGLATRSSLPARVPLGRTEAAPRARATRD